MANKSISISISINSKVWPYNTICLLDTVALKSLWAAALQEETQLGVYVLLLYNLNLDCVCDDQSSQHVRKFKSPMDTRCKKKKCTGAS